MPNSIPSKIKTTLKLRTCETQNFSLQDKKMHACHKQQEHPGFTSGSRTSSAWLRGGLDGVSSWMWSAGEVGVGEVRDGKKLEH